MAPNTRDHSKSIVGLMDKNLLRTIAHIGFVNSQLSETMLENPNIISNKKEFEPIQKNDIINTVVEEKLYTGNLQRVRIDKDNYKGLYKKLTTQGITLKILIEELTTRLGVINKVSQQTNHIVHNYYPYLLNMLQKRENKIKEIDLYPQEKMELDKNIWKEESNDIIHYNEIINIYTKHIKDIFYMNNLSQE